MSLIETLREELKGKTVSQLMQELSDRQKEIIQAAGGSFGDVPVRKNDEFHIIQQKLHLLNLGPDKWN